MQKIILDNRSVANALYPFTAIRHTADIRIGILTIREKFLFNNKFEVFSSYEDYFGKYPATKEYPIQLPANIVPGETWLNDFMNLIKEPGNGGFAIEDSSALKILNHSCEIFKHNDWALREDFKLITNGRVSQTISASNRTINETRIFIEPGAKVEHCILNASTGPIYIGKNALVMEGSMIRGPFALCEGAVVKMGSKIYGATTVGPYCSVGGEIKNAVLLGYSNKGHDGYLGDSVIGEWCNIGAGTSVSNIKNNCGDVKFWVDGDKKEINAGVKAGLLLGDYSKTAINTSFNTGTVVGICCNVVATGLAPKYIPHFTWGSDGITKYKLSKALEDINKWKHLKGFAITEKETKILTDIYKKI
jgi:UDP-N-acetylglucosamine diphosphorylase / glucose-1-phosphate thymidylyltransferase / UDP-N-acetylgalactosamine diphosphorylase / glucosamine-1-phosphate N-acetyltransferase / galactosamine-1-phosphate N-acetyltransferase